MYQSAHAPGLAIYQFGSARNGYKRPNSDVGLAILPAKSLTATEHLVLTNKLIDVARCDVIDLLDFSNKIKQRRNVYER